jgi:hypothetical protein
MSENKLTEVRRVKFIQAAMNPHTNNPSQEVNSMLNLRIQADFDHRILIMTALVRDDSKPVPKDGNDDRPMVPHKTRSSIYVPMENVAYWM